MRAFSEMFCLDLWYSKCGLWTSASSQIIYYLSAMREIQKIESKYLENFTAAWCCCQKQISVGLCFTFSHFSFHFSGSSSLLCFEKVSVNDWLKLIGIKINNKKILSLPLDNSRNNSFKHTMIRKHTLKSKVQKNTSRFSYHFHF